MRLNWLSGRSFNNLSQYPVLPWIFALFKSKEMLKEMGQDPEAYTAKMKQNATGNLYKLKDKEFQDAFDLSKFMEKVELRNLEKPMGALGSEQRTNAFLERYNSKDMFSDVPSYFYGSHYSSPAIILHYLIRLEPFTEGAKEIQNGQFDLADRLFFSIEYSYRNTVEEMSDVRELIPEFFTCPEFMLNLNKLDFGISQNGERVHNVKLPNWAYQNPYYFVYMHRRMLESEKVSNSVHGWMDLVFGYKQKGKEAEKNMNVFYHLTYEDSVDMDELPDLDRQGIETQVVHFG